MFIMCRPKPLAQESKVMSWNSVNMESNTSPKYSSHGGKSFFKQFFLLSFVLERTFKPLVMYVGASG